MATKLESLSTKLQSALDLANSLPDAITLDELTNPGSAATMLEGTEMLDAEGKKVTGTIESKDSSDLTISGPFFTAPAGYYPEDSQVTMADAILGDTTITVNDSGLIYARPNIESDGYISDQNSIVIPTTKQLPTQSATTITPTKSSQTAVAAGKYTTGAVTVAAIPSQYITTTDANAASADIVSSKTAYVNGVKVTGTNPYEKATTDAQVSEIGELVAELEAAMEGKSVGGGSGSGGAIETCTVTISNEDVNKISFYQVIAAVYRDGLCNLAIGTHSTSGLLGELDMSQSTLTIHNVVCGSDIYVVPSVPSGCLGCTTNNASKHASFGGYIGETGNLMVRVFTITAPANGTATITLYDDD